MKLSPKMQEVMNQLTTAPFYYMDSTKEDHGTIETLHTPEGNLGYWANKCGHHARRVTDNRIIIRECTGTLRALEKRGLIEVLHYGDASLDCVRVIGLDEPEPLTKAFKLEVTRTWDDAYCRKVLTQTLTEYAAMPDYMDTVKEFRNKGAEVIIKSEVEIELTIWNPEFN